MKSINPLHIIALLLVLLLFVFFQLGRQQTKLQDAQASYKETSELAVKLAELKKVYGDKQQMKRSINNILKHRTLQSAGIQQSIGKSSVKLSAPSIDKTALNLLMGKVLNASFNITSMKIKKLSDEKASLDMEIAW